MKPPLITALTLALALLPAGASFAGNHQPLTEAEVRKVDMDAKKITLRHGPIPNLDMPAMTMVFQVSEPALLEQVKTGDRVLFEAEKAGGAYIVTRIRKK
jgi:Cu(I)/Ag(I) efflux system protein CusF